MLSFGCAQIFFSTIARAQDLVDSIVVVVLHVVVTLHMQHVLFRSSPHLFVRTTVFRKPYNSTRTCPVVTDGQAKTMS